MPVRSEYGGRVESFWCVAYIKNGDRLMMMNIRNSFIFDYKTSFGNGFVPNFIEIGVAFYL